MKLKVLLLEDNPADVEFIQRELNNSGKEAVFKVTDSREEFENGIWRFQPDVILSDHTLPEFNSTDALQLYKPYKEKLDKPTAFILVTGSISEEFAVSKIIEGADDYILKDRMHRLPMAIDQALHKNASILERQKAIGEQSKLLNDINLLLKSTKDGIYGIDEKGLCTFINDAALKMFGYKKEQCIGVNMHKLVHYKKNDQRHYPETECPIYNHSARNESCRVENEVFWRSDGSYFHVEYHSSPIIEGGNPKGSVVVFVDITDKVIDRSRKDLAYSLNKIFDEEDDLDKCLEYLIREICICEGKYAGEIWVTNFESRELRLSAHFCRTGSLNYDNLQLSFKKGEGLLGHVLQLKEHIFVSDVQTELKYLSKEFSRINNLHSAIAVPIVYKENSIAVIMIYSNKIEEFQHSNFLLQKDLLIQIGQSMQRKKTENELSAIFENSPDIICIAGNDGFFKKTNPAFTNLLGYSEKELTSRPYVDFIHNGDRKATLEEAVKVFSGYTAYNFQNRYIAKNGDVKWLSWTSKPLVTKELVLGIAKDVTQKLQLEQQIHDEKIKQQIRIRDAIITAQEEERKRIGAELHDNICQLLALSSMYIGMAINDVNTKTEILEEANNMVLTSIKDIRNLSHQLVPVMVYKKSLEKSLEDLISNIAFMSELDIKFACKDVVDESLSPELKLGLYRIVQEQFNNIIKHAKAKKVKLTLEQKGNNVTIKLTDNGIGFDTTQQTKGIGLLNMETRVAAFKGTIKIISFPGKGCKLEVSVPLLPDLSDGSR